MDKILYVINISKKCEKYFAYFKNLFYLADAKIQTINQIGMKRFLFFGLTILAILFSGCSDDLDFQNENSTQDDLTIERTGTINQTEAIAIASKVLGRDLTRGGGESAVKCEYVFRKDSPVRNENLPDTLAYVINYPDKKGFVIVAGDRRVNPVLAYSDEGTFSFENEAVVDCFISKIGSYIASSERGDQYSTDDVIGIGDMKRMSIKPPTHVLISQEAPWDKYVQEEHPESHTGCVPVATVLMMLHSQKTFIYHGEKYYSRSILRPLNKGFAVIGDASDPQITIQPPITFDPVYSYTQSEDIIAKLLYLVGKDVGVEYIPKEPSKTRPQNAYDFLVSQGFPLATTYKAFNEYAVIQNLLLDNYIYVSGITLDYKDGHSWIISGCEYDYNKDVPSDVTNVYFYCDWGWGDEQANGYYSGEIFSGKGNNGTFKFAYEPYYFFAVQRDWTTL